MDRSVWRSIPFKKRLATPSDLDPDAKSDQRAAAKNMPSLVALSAYAFGLSGLWAGVGAAILPFKVLQLLHQGPVVIWGFQFDKNGTLGIISLLGLVVAAIVQPIAGYLSDRSDPRYGKRLPWMLVGGFGLALLCVYFGIATSLAAIVGAIALMQIFGNLLQGPANALIVDSVPASRFGAASGALNLAKVAGAGVVTLVVLRMMGNFNPDEPNRVWMWAAVIFMGVLVVGSMLWTVLVLRPRQGAEVVTAPVRERQKQPASAEDAPPRERFLQGHVYRYVWFLVALTFVVAALSAMQVYALFFLQDVIGVENPANSADLLVVVMGIATAATVLPAGSFADRFGKERILVVAGFAAAVAALGLLLVHSMLQVLVIAVFVGGGIGIFLSVGWALANDLVLKGSPGRDLGMIGIAWLVGAAMARASGPGIDFLNNRSEDLGYHVMIIGVAIAFCLASVILGYVSSQYTAAERSNAAETDSQDTSGSGAQAHG